MEFEISISDVISIVTYTLLLAGCYFSLRQKIAIMQKENEQHKERLKEIGKQQRVAEGKVEGKIKELKTDITNHLIKVEGNIGEMQKDIRDLLIKISKD